MTKIHDALKAASLAIAASVLIANSTSVATAASASTDAVRCVQKELNALGFDAGLSDGIVGVKTFLAGEAYVRFMKANAEPGWAQPSLHSGNALHWCEKVADAHPKVAPFWHDLQKSDVPADPKAVFDMAYKFDTGTGVKRDDELAVRWYLRAAELGYAPAQRNLGGMYGSGRGVQQNDNVARYWFLAAANQGDSQAAYVLGMHYSADNETSLKWLWKAAQSGHAGAISELESRLDI